MVRHHYTTTQLIAKEGWNHIVFTFMVFLLSYALSFFSWFFFFVLVVTIYIYRNPERIVEESDELTLLSPVDGTILKISKVDLKDGSEALCVVIRKSIWDVGILRAPIGMEIIEVKNRFGLFISSGSSLFSNLCERKTFTCKNKFTSFKIVVSAGRLSQSIVFFNKNAYKANERFGFLREGEVALLLPLDVRIKVSLNHSVKAGESVLGYLAYKDNHDKQ
ncbi:phosphatidylserine decarboxylase [Sulfurospirillum deleyianum]|uniref:Phosphatidylserine decarboxylase-related protein n=1 Tax=Sulfurospirillum deleyianum (strain ATCC 51133 / DSM 6946 / 5175) TaxID=525898 RepID=D1B3V5_SULD5|nr:phosphatidylserine decarboxylase [Sulfurospirillum deleyianum]ACZ12775.1 phosphatidylserine decarboxylase-related protein [Sulfurospirillum deleyianum DSM 6946]